MLETDDPYNPYSCSSPDGLPVQKLVQEVVFLPDRAGPLDNDGIKQAVMTYGAVYTCMYWNSSYYNSGTCAYYYTGPDEPNHAVCIVGWDDNFDSSFPTTPPGDGAFIIRNSWGTGWGESGYFYLSYYDSYVGTENAVFENAEPTTTYSQVYQYDPLGWVTALGYGTDTAWFANVFTSTSDQQMAAVSWYTASPNSTYEIRIYLDPSSGPINPAGPIETKTGTAANVGYQTVPLDTTVAVSTGQVFSVVVRLTTPFYTYPVPLEYPYPGYASGATAGPGESYISADGASWADVTDYYPNTNVCLKAFAVEATTTPTFSPDGGTYSAPQTVTISCATPGAIIRYTTDGIDPTESSPVYSGPVLVDRTLTLKAKAWKTGLPPSGVKSALYIIPGRISEAKVQPNDSLVAVKGVVTAAFANLFYTESQDRSSGIAVYKSDHGLAVGTRVEVIGTTSTTSYGEKSIQATSVVENGTGTIEPLVMANRGTGGADWEYDPATGAGQKGVTEYRLVMVNDEWVGMLVDAIGLNNIGLLVCTTGRVTYVGTTYFYIDDGSGASDSADYGGIRVYAPGVSLPAVDDYIRVTGISSCFKASPQSTNLYRLIRVRDQADVVVLE